MSAEPLTLGELATLRRAVAAGSDGCSTPSGETGGETVARLAGRGLLRWEQSSPFIAWMWATPLGAVIARGGECEACDGAGAFDFEGRPDPNAPELCTACGGQSVAHQVAVEVLRQWNPDIMLGEANALAQKVLDAVLAAEHRAGRRPPRAAEALRLTQEYVGDELLPPVAGWSWFDALRAHERIRGPGE